MADLGQKIGELPAASTLDGDELIPVVQDGATKKSTAAAVETLVKDSLSKADVGLSNVANERQYSALNPPPTPTAADVGAIPANQKGVADGVAELDSGGKVPSSQLPSYVDDVLEYASASAFPVTGESGKIYVAIDTGRTYRWSGSTYVEISNPVIIDDTLSVEGAAADAAAVGEALDDKQDTLTFDNDPTAGSTNPVKSSGIYDAILKLYPTDTVSGAVASFPDGADGMPVKSLTVNIEPVQAGSGDPGPGNIRPISGFTGATVTRVGKNLFPPYFGPTTAGGVTMTLNNDGSFYLEGTASVTAFTASRILPFPVASGTNVSFRLGNDLINSEVGLRVIRSASGSSTLYGTLHRAIEVDRTAEGVAESFAANRVQAVVASNHGDVTKITLKPQLELGDKATAWEPYTEETVTISWEAEAGTVYGGSLDLTAGVLTVTEGYIAAYDGEELPGKWISDRDVYAEGTSPSTGAQVVYTLAEPLTYRLASGALHTVLGVNHIFSDAGEVEVEYRADIVQYILKQLPAAQGTLGLSRPALTLGVVNDSEGAAEDEHE